MSKASFIIFTILGFPLLIVGFFFGPTAFDLAFHRSPPERFLIPAGYKGWVRIDYRRKGAPPLPTEAGHVLFRLTSQGTLQTSSDPRPGHGKDDFFYYSGEGRTELSNAGVCKGGMVWQIEALVDENTSLPFSRFFVGSEDQYRREVDPAGKEPACE
jgi:hypothetical protein